jgi:hypothetical protein
MDVMSVIEPTLSIGKRDVRAGPEIAVTRPAVGVISIL